MPAIKQKTAVRAAAFTQKETYLSENSTTNEGGIVLLSKAEESRLAQCEARIARGLETFVDVGNALVEIRDSRLYRKTHQTFEAYCAGKWNLTKPRAYQLIEAAEVVGNLETSTIVDLPKTESQARPLTRLEPEVQREVWREVVKTTPPAQITARVIEEKARAAAPLNEAVKEIKQAAAELPFSGAAIVVKDEKELLQKANEIKHERAEERREKQQAARDGAPWTDSQEERRESAMCGETVIANMKTDLALVGWATKKGIFVQIDRTTDWGNPFNLGTDGDRDYVCDSFAIYLKRKPSLLSRLPLLQGKVLGCWCYPERCHGRELVKEFWQEAVDAA